MALAYFDTIAGISGDMTLGAFVSAGVPFDTLCSELSKLNLKGFELEASHVEHSGIVATHIDVIISAQPTYHRHLRDINDLIDASGLSDQVRQRAKSIFLEIARAEAAVHASTIDEVHFHEVGAIDSLVDIVGAALCLDYFKITEVYSSPVKIGGGGFVPSEHGQLPVPTPATMEILKGYPTVLTDVQAELTTPTGAAIVKALSKGMMSIMDFTARVIGYGAGTRTIEGLPNLLRIMIGDRSQGFQRDDVVQIETTIDNMNPELYPYVIEQLLASGALDAFLTPILMKKGRPGMVLSVLCPRSEFNPVLRTIFRETTTLGVRILPVERRTLQRSQREAPTSLGTVRVKAIEFEGKMILAPEFEECKRIAQEQGIPLREVYRILEKELGST